MRSSAGRGDKGEHEYQGQQGYASGHEKFVNKSLINL
jgi:hypothetical protein